MGNESEMLEKFWSFYRFKIDIKEFEDWVYSYDGLETVIGSEIFLELVSYNFKDKYDQARIRDLVELVIYKYDYKCSCIKLSSVDIIGMGSDSDYYLDTIDHVKDRGEKYWWLHLSQCNVCKNYWLIAQEERHNDDYHLKRLSNTEAINILENNIWPNDFDSFEKLLILSKNEGHSVRFIDPLNSLLVYSVIDLVKERPDIKFNEIAELLNIDIELAKELQRNLWK